MNRKIRMGMIGGGKGAFIGGVHRMAAALDGQIELVCGAFSSNPERSIESGKELFLEADRCYPNFEAMILGEKQRPETERMDFVSIVTPNHMHYPPAKMALEHGFHVICDKPLAFTLEEALELEELVTSSGLEFALTHNYTGYPMIKEARTMIGNGKLGKIRKVIAEYPQGWLSTFVEESGQKQAAWRTDPSKSGIAGSMGDIGTHAENLLEYVTGLKISEVCADLSIFVEGRKLDDDGSVLLRFDSGAKGILQASQIAAGEENNLSLRVYGETGGLTWRQMEPNTLIYHTNDQRKVIRTGVGDLSEQSTAHTRVPAGHPEGYLEAFANIYRNFAFALRNRMNGEDPDPVYDYPSVSDGVRGMKFIEAVVESSNSDNKWIHMS